MIAQKVMAVKWIEIASMQFLSTSFLRKLAVFFLQRNDAPSLALLVCEWGEIAWSDRTRSAGHSSPAICSRRIGKLEKLPLGDLSEVPASFKSL
ncbi:MAG TPA: hypothetical protein DCP61_00190 [Treponema sp.]|nr:hypothetical protein [Treponema sp.]